jgi:hypothetical protein
VNVCVLHRNVSECVVYAVAYLVEVGSIPDEVSVFYCHKHSGRTVALVSSNRNEYQGYHLRVKGGRCVRPTTLPPSCADCLEIWEPEPSGTLRACPGL